MTRRRFMLGFGTGVVATLVMTVVMLVSRANGVSPLPQPIPVAIVAQLLSLAVPKVVLMGLAIIAHLAYGGAWAGLLWLVARRVTVLRGIGLGVLLWVIMQLVVLPYLGWGLFGSALTLSIAGATLILHLVYGTVLGVGGQYVDAKCVAYSAQLR